MANKRMIGKEIIESDVFFSLPDKSRIVYFYLLLNADDDGFIGNTKSVVRRCSANLKSLVPLIEKGLVHYFSSGVSVIIHWRLQNRIDRKMYKPTIYREELARLVCDSRGIYSLTPTLDL